MDYVVIGAGPAGLQLAYFLERAGRDYVVLEAGPTPGTFYRTFPRHRRMISINKPHTGWHDVEKDLRVDWNSLLSDDPALRFTRYTGRYFPHADDYVRYLTDFGRGLNIRYGRRVACVGQRLRGPLRERRGIPRRPRDRRNRVRRHERAAHPGHRGHRTLLGRAGRPGGIHRPARAHHRQGQLRL